MKGIPIGIVGFLGIFAPGALLVTNAILLWSQFEPATIREALTVNDFGKGSLTFILVLLSFTVGMCLRMIPPRCADSFGGIVHKIIRPWRWRKKTVNAFAESVGRYTAEGTMGWWKDALGHVPEALWTTHLGPWECDIPKDQKNRDQIAIWRRVRLFNYAKRAITHQSESLGREVLLAESYVRFVSGVMWSLTLGGLAGIAAAVVWRTERTLTELPELVVLCVVNVAMLVFAALRVGEMRRYEAEMGMQSFLVVNEVRRSSPTAGTPVQQSR